MRHLIAALAIASGYFVAVNVWELSAVEYAGIVLYVCVIANLLKDLGE